MLLNLADSQTSKTSLTSVILEILRTHGNVNFVGVHLIIIFFNNVLHKEMSKICNKIVFLQCPCICEE